MISASPVERSNERKTLCCVNFASKASRMIWSLTASQSGLSGFSLLRPILAAIIGDLAACTWSSCIEPANFCAWK
jgi:hypothetical protein